MRRHAERPPSQACRGARSYPYSTIPALLRRASVRPRQYLLQGPEEPPPPVRGALIRLLLISPEARLLHAQPRSRARRGESPSDDTLETIGSPRVRQGFVRLDCHDLTVDGAPLGAKTETVIHD